MTDASITPRPTLPNRRELIVGGALLAAAGIAYVRTPRTEMKLISKGQLEKMVPTEIGHWRYETASGLVLPPPDQLAQLIYDQQLSRVYSSPEALTVMMVMAYGSSQGGMLQIHRPETCYPASGFKLTNTVEGQMPIGPGRVIPVRRFTALSDTRTEQLLYWTRIGNLLPTSWATQRLAVMDANLHGFIPDGLLVRLSTVTQDAAQGQAAIQAFAQMMIAAMTPGTRRLLIGNAT